MALTLDVTTALQDDKTPTGHTAPTVSADVGSTPNTVKFTYTVATSGLTHADTAATGLSSVISQVDTYITDTYIPTTLGIDVTGNTVTAVGTINAVRRANSGFDTEYDTEIYVTGTDQFEIDITLQWAIS